jgi:glutaredoxin
MRKVTVYTKPECGLCDEALAAVERVRARSPFELEKVDISGDPALRRAYGMRIPVVALDGEDLFDYFVDEAELERLLAQAPATAPPQGARPA